MNNTQSAPTSPPWWKFGHVWLIIAGPAVVVVAGFITLWLAIRTPDPVITPDHYRTRIEIGKTPDADPSSLAPAVQARNHAQTGVPTASPDEGKGRPQP